MHQRKISNYYETLANFCSASRNILRIFFQLILPYPIESSAVQSPIAADMRIYTVENKKIYFPKLLMLKQINVFTLFAISFCSLNFFK